MSLNDYSASGSLSVRLFVKVLAILFTAEIGLILFSCSFEVIKVAGVPKGIPIYEDYMEEEFAAY